MLTPLKIFCCHAHEDASYFKKLKNHLMPLQFQKHIDIKSEADIEIGDEREKMLQEHLAEAKIILLLISPDFIASHYAEILQAIKYHDQNVAVVIPILIRPIFWKDAPFAHLKLLPTNNKAVSSWTFEDEALSQIAEEISKIVIELRIRQFETEAFYSQSLELYEYILQFLKPDYARAYEAIGGLYYTQGKYEEALHNYKKAEKLDENISFPLRKQAEILNKLQRYKESLEIYKQALIGHEAEWQIRAEMAEIHVQLGEREAALSLYQEILLLQPGMKTYFVKAGELFFQLGQYQQAQEMYVSAIELDPWTVKYHAALGEIYYKLGKHREALKAYEQAIQLQTCKIDYLFKPFLKESGIEDAFINEMSYRRGQLFKVVRIEGWDRVDDFLNDIWYKQGQLSLILRSYEEALQYFDKLEHHTYAHYYKSRALKALNRYEEALEEANNAIVWNDEVIDDPRFLENKCELFELLAQKARQEAQQVRVEWIKQEKLSFIPESITFLKEFSAHADQVNCLAITPDGSRLFSGSSTGGIREWYGNEKSIFKHEFTTNLPTILNLDISSNGQSILSSSYTGNIKIWNLLSLRETTITIDDKSIYSAALSHNGLMLVSHDSHYTIKLWKRLGNRTPFNPTTVKTLAISSNPPIILGGPEITIVLFSLDDQDIFIGHPNGTLEKIALNSEEGNFRIKAHNGDINDLKLSPDNKILVSSSKADHRIHLWNSQTGKYLNTLSGHNNSVYKLAVHPDGQLLASQGGDKTIRFWNLKTGELLYTMDDEGLTQCILFNPTEPLLYTGGKDGKIRVWSFL